MYQPNREYGARAQRPAARVFASLLALGALVVAAPALAQAPAANPQAASTPAASTPAASASQTKSAAPSKRKMPQRPCPPQMSEELNPPPDATLQLAVSATGVQSYACGSEKPGEAPDWQPKGPHANLFDGATLFGIHSGGPSWQALDGSSVKGTKLTSAPSPDKSAAVWLLLSGAPSGEGTFGKITHIQRLNTVGGKPPTTGCDASHLDTKVLVPYRADYYFYRLSEPGEKVKQCRGTLKKPVPVEKKPAGAAPGAEKKAAPAAEKKK